MVSNPSNIPSSNILPSGSGIMSSMNINESHDRINGISSTSMNECGMNRNMNMNGTLNMNESRGASRVESRGTIPSLPPHVGTPVVEDEDAVEDNTAGASVQVRDVLLVPSLRVFHDSV